MGRVRGNELKNKVEEFRFNKRKRESDKFYELEELNKKELVLGPEVSLEEFLKMESDK